VAKRIIKGTAFFLCLCVMLFVLCDLFEHENNTNMNQRHYTYRSLSKNTVDVVAIGKSGIDRYIVPSQAYEDFGITAFPFATDAFPCWLYIDAIKEIKRYQDPEIFIIDIRPFGQDNTKAKTLDVRARRYLDVVSPFSPSRFSAALKTIEILKEVDSESVKDNELSYFFSFIRYHSKWLEDDYRIENNLGETEHSYLGFFVSDERSLATADIKAKKI